jgi:DinB family protein/metal binding Ada-like protein
LRKVYTLLGTDRRPYQSPTPGGLGGHKRSRVYGRLDCPAALRAIARGGYVKSRAFFADEKTAVSAGFRPCAVCLPERYAQWKLAKGRLVDKRPPLLKRLDKAWCAFKQSYAGLSDPELLEPGVTGAWSVRDIIAHVTTWEEETLKHLPLILTGKRPPRYSATYGGIDAFNARTTEQKKNLSLLEVFRQQEDVHRRLIELIEGVPENQLGGDTRFRHRLRLDTYGHYPKHADAITQWRRSRRARRSPAPSTSAGTSTPGTGSSCGTPDERDST